jgi:hypothetical protein
MAARLAPTSSSRASFVMFPVVAMSSCRGEPLSRWLLRKSASFVTTTGAVHPRWLRSAGRLIDCPREAMGRE